MKAMDMVPPFSKRWGEPHPAKVTVIPPIGMKEVGEYAHPTIATLGPVGCSVEIWVF